MIENLYTKYFQKSRSFLYPVLGIKKSGKFTPINTYVAIEGLIESTDCKLVCTFKSTSSRDFEMFVTDSLLSNPLYQQNFTVEDKEFYIFDFINFDDDWDHFLKGKYSKLSNVMKKAIKSYYGEHSAEYDYIDSYLYPEKYFSLYAKLLDVDVRTLKETGELCDPYDPKKEVIKIPVEYLENLKSKLIL
jgi:hypothetical protein